MTVTTTSRQQDEQTRIARALNRRIRSGRKFTVDEIWPGLRDIVPGHHMSWVGNHVRKLEQGNAIRFVGWRETPRSKPHSRPARVWQSEKHAEKTAA